MLEKEIRSINGMPLKDAKARTSLDTFKKEISLQIKENKNDVQQQINNLVLGAVGDGNNAEVIQARGGYDVLNDRLSDSDSQLKYFQEDVAIIKMDNLFNKDKIVKYTRLNNTTGLPCDPNPESLSSYFTIKIKNINSAKNYHSNTDLIIKISEFDINDNFIKINSYANTNMSTSIKFDDTCDYIYIQGYLPDMPNYLVFCEEDYKVSKNVYIRYGKTFTPKSLEKEIIEGDNVRTEDTEGYVITNYCLFLDIIQNKKFSATGEVVDSSSGTNVTSFVKLDKNKNMYGYTTGNTKVGFYTKDKTFISFSSFYYRHPLEKTSYPETAYYVRFEYYVNTLMTDKFAVSTFHSDFAKTIYPTILKKDAQRPIVNIYTSDSQLEIFRKMADAFYTGDCDVYFEYGEYTFNNTIFDYMKTNLGWTSRFELPIGRNCRYYLNNATLIANNDSSDTSVKGNTSLMGTRDRDDTGSYEIQDGTLKAYGTVYIVHDEGSAGYEPYIHKHKNLVFDYHVTDNTQQTISKCIGGGTGLYGTSIIEDCIFINDHTLNDVSYHGHLNDDSESLFKLFVTGNYFTNNLGLHSLGANEKAILLYSGNSAIDIPSSSEWTIYNTSNVKR